MCFHLAEFVCAAFNEWLVYRPNRYTIMKHKFIYDLTDCIGKGMTWKAKVQLLMSRIDIFYRNVTFPFWANLWSSRFGFKWTSYAVNSLGEFVRWEIRVYRALIHSTASFVGCYFVIIRNFFGQLRESSLNILKYIFYYIFKCKHIYICFGIKYLTPGIVFYKPWPVFHFIHDIDMYVE